VRVCVRACVRARVCVYVYERERVVACVLSIGFKSEGLSIGFKIEGSGIRESESKWQRVF